MLDSRTMEMSVHPAEIVIAIQAIQAVAAIILAALLLHFHKGFRQYFLLHWALSAAALAIYLVTSAAALALYWGGAALDAGRLAFSAISLAAAYAHVAWLMTGTWEATRRRAIRPRHEAMIIGMAVLIGIVSALVAPFDPEAAGLRNLLRVDLRYFATGTAFIVAGILLWRAQTRRGPIGARLGAAGFVLFGMQMMHVVGINLWNRGGHPAPFYTPYIGLLDFLFQSIIALGIVVWLFELQRRRVHRTQNEIERLRLHDPTSGLPNRELLLEHLRQMIRVPDTRIVVLSLGINRYSVLTRALGWHRTERVIRRIADRIRKHLEPGFALGRMNERDFVVIGPAPANQERLRACAESMLAEVMHPLVVDGQEIFVSACAGISLYPQDAHDPEPLLENSQHALVQSARIGRDVTLYHHLSHDLARQPEASLHLETELRRALDHRQFEMHYQAIVRVTDQRVMGYEALMRWRHPTNGLLSPDQFLDQAAGIGLLGALEQHALQEALRQIAEWNRVSDSGLFVAVNLSARRFLAPGLVKETLAECQRLGVDPKRLEVEITENTALQDLDAAAARIAELHEAGIRVSLDDFGTGFSSLANLLKLKVARIKLDRIFVEGVAHNPRQRELVAAMIELGHRLELDVVAEGIEHPDQFRFLEGLKCDYVQGFLLHRPMPARDCQFEVQVEA